MTSTGLNPGTNYRLCSLDKAETLMGDTVQLIRLRDPLADSSFGQTSGYNGDWSNYSNQWERVSLQERDRLLGQLDVGEFWMAFVDFITNFTHLECVHLDSDTSRDEPSLADKSRRWLMRLYQGSWKRGVSAGGCRNNPDSFHINPQLQLVLNDREDVIISLNQHSVMEPKVIGFTLYSLNQQLPQSKVTECLPKAFFKHKSLLNSQYTNSRQISQRCSLEAGRYIIMATTFEPAEESAFSVRVLGGSIRLSLLETQTMLLLDPFQTIGTGSGSLSVSSYKLNQANDDMASVTSGTAQYEPVFLQLADDHKTISCFDLQELLEACLPNDYIRSCANLDVCRQIVCLMDKQNRSRITFNDFKLFMINLKTWQGVFKMHTKEKTGILRAERFRDALCDVGFQLSTDILSILILKYMRRDGTMRLADFVSAILHLTMAFELFKTKDTNQDNQIKMGLNEWIKSVLIC